MGRMMLCQKDRLGFYPMEVQLRYPNGERYGSRYENERHKKCYLLCDNKKSQIEMVLKLFFNKMKLFALRAHINFFFVLPY